MKNILTILSLILCINGFSQSLYIPTNPDSIKVPVNVNGAVRTVYNIDLTKYRAALTARDTAAALRLVIATNTTAINKKQQNIGWVNVMDFGADSTGATSNTTAFANAIATLASGGTLFIPHGNFMFSSNLTVNKPIHIIGEGMGRSYGLNAITKITCASNINLWTLTSSGVTIERIGFEWTGGGKATSAKAIYCLSSDAVNNVIQTTASRYTLRDVSVINFYDNIYIERGAGWTIDNSFLVSAERYNLHIENTINQDEGDWQISNTQFFQYSADAGGYGIHQTGSGGGKIVNCKFNGLLDYDYWVTLGTTASSIVLVSNSSFENFTIEAIHALNFSFCKIEGCEFAPYRTITGTAIVYFSGITGGVIADNIFVGTSGTANKAFSVNGGSNTSVSGNSYSGFASATPYEIVGGANNVVTPTVATTSNGVTGSVQFNSGFPNTGGGFGSDNALFFDNTNKRLGVGFGASPTIATRLDVLAATAGADGINTKNSNAGGSSTVNVNNDLNTQGFFRTYGSTFSLTHLADATAFGATKDINIFTDAGVTNGGTHAINMFTGGYNQAQIRLKINSSGNVGIGSNVNATSTLQTTSFATAYVAKTTAYTATISDYTIDCNGTFTVTLPTAVGITGRIYVIKNSGTGTITLAGTSAQTFDGATSPTIATQFGILRIQSNGANWIVL